jgi:two-component system OmpR family sensor kinase
MTTDPSVHATGFVRPPPPAGSQPVDPNSWQSLPPTPPWDELEPLTEPKPPRRWRLAPRSLTGRLVTGVVSLVVVLVLATGTATFFALQSFLNNRLDQQVETTAAQPARQLIESGTFSPSPQTIWITQLSSSGAVLDHLGNAGQVRHMTMSASDRLRLAHGTAGPVSVTTVDGDHLRVISEPQPPLLGVVVIGLSTQDSQRTLHRLLVLEISIGASAVALALILTAWGVRFSLRPLRRVTSTAREVTAELSPEGAGLDRRVAVTESDTEVGQLAESMNTLLGAVETQFAARLANEQRMRQFLADASHELRTPLTSIRGYAELARMQRQQGNDANSNADSLERIESEGTRMSRLVDDLLTLARSDQGGEPKHEWVDIAELLGDAVNGTRAAYPARRIDLSAPHGLHVIGDRDQLLRVMRNLITNAAVHTAPGGPIGVTATREGHWVVVRVSDAGPGLPQEEAAHVFERFWRADKARTRARGGSGLGLAIVASIVQAHGGGVRFDSSVERGSTVTVSLPIGAASGMA